MTPAEGEAQQLVLPPFITIRHCVLSKAFQYIPDLLDVITELSSLTGICGVHDLELDLV